MESNQERQPEVLKALRQWEADTNAPASPTEGSAFMDGYREGWQARASQEPRPLVKDSGPRIDTRVELMPEPRPQSGELREAIKAKLVSIAKDAGNYDGNAEPHCHQCAHDEAAILDAADDLDKWLAAFAASEREQEPGYLPQQSLGDVPGTEKCPRCGGSGRVKKPDGIGSMSCPDCGHSDPESAKGETNADAKA